MEFEEGLRETYMEIFLYFDTLRNILIRILIISLNRQYLFACGIILCSDFLFYLIGCYMLIISFLIIFNQFLLLTFI